MIIYTHMHANVHEKYFCRRIEVNADYLQSPEFVFYYHLPVLTAEPGSFLVHNKDFGFWIYIIFGRPIILIIRRMYNWKPKQFTEFTMRAK